MLQDAISSALPDLRAQAASTMLDTLAFGTIVRGAQDPTTGLEADVFVATFTTKGKIAGASQGGADLAVRMVDIGGVQRPVITGGVHIPFDRTNAVPSGMLVKVMTLGPRSPHHLLGRLYRIEGESVKSYETARRFDVVEVS